VGGNAELSGWAQPERDGFDIQLLCGLFGQSALVAAAGAKKGLSVNLKKPE